MRSSMDFDLLTLLSPNVIKHRVYARDPAYVGSAAMFRERWTADSDLADTLWNYATMLLRPDAIAGRRSAAVFPMLREHNIYPVAVRPVNVTPAKTEDMWKYQFNVATPERRLLLKRIFAAGTAVYVVLRDDNPRELAPATVNVTYLKGTAIVKNRRRWHLRTVAGPHIANLLSYVHVSDDPIDLVREMAVLFDAPQRHALLSEIDAAEDRTAEAIALIRRMETLVPRKALSPEPASTDMMCAESRASFEHRLLCEWRSIVRDALATRSFVTGETYNTMDALVPDDKRLSLPLDADLIFRELGPRY